MSDNKKYKDDSYRDWLKRRNHLNNDVMNYKRYQWETLKKYSYLVVGLIGFIYLIIQGCCQ